MDNQNGSSSWATRDITMPLLISGMISTGACVVLCIGMTIYSDVFKPDAESVFGQVEPTSTRFVPTTLDHCPGIPAGWEKVIDEDFVDDQNYWFPGVEEDQYGQAETLIADGLLHLNVRADQRAFYARDPYRNATTKDFFASVLVRKVSGPDDAEYGLTFRMVGDQVLFFAIQDSGDVKVGIRDMNSNWLSPPLLDGYTDEVNIGNNNRLVVLVREDYYAFCVNQQLVGQKYDAGYPLGEFGVGVELEHAGDEAAFEFDELTVYIPPK